MSTAKTARTEPAPTTEPTAPAVPYPIPVGTPPGGGRWTWDVTAGKWVSLDPPPAEPEPTAP